MLCVNNSIIHCVAILLVQSALLFVIGKCDHSNLTSPCPRFFTYENNTEVEDRWYGAITLLSDYDLNGVWIRVAFDKPVEQMKSTFGEIRHREHNEYLIKDRNFQLVKSVPQVVRFYVQYPIEETPAQLVTIRLNGRVVCPEADPASTTTQRLFTSWESGDKDQEDLEKEHAEMSKLDVAVSQKHNTPSNIASAAVKVDSVDKFNSTKSQVGVPDKSVNEVESKLPEEHKTLYVSN